MNSIRYCFDPKTGEFSSAVSCALSPARPFDAAGNPVFLEPANSELSAPPSPGDGQAAVYAGGSWILVEDHRGKTDFCKASGAPSPIAELGPVAAGLTLLPPPSPDHVFDEAAGSWEIDPAKAAPRARQRRNALLAASDWTQLADTALSDETRAAWRTYRQALRDLMAGWTPSAPWPVAPDARS